MIKNAIAISLFILAILLLFLYPSLAFAEVKEIISEGTYNMGDAETPMVAESRALLQAKRVAIEQAGTYIESYSKVKNFELTVDEIQMMASGLMEVEVLEKKRIIFGDGINFWVKIKARVSTDKMEEMKRRVKEKSLIEDYKRIQEAYDRSQKEIWELKRHLAEEKEEQKRKQVEAKIVDQERLFMAKEWLERGYKYKLNRDYDGAIEAYTEAIVLDPNNHVAYSNRGVLYYEKGQYDIAIKDFNRVTILTPNIVFLGGLFSAETIEGLNKEIDLNPKDFLAYYRRGLEYIKRGNINKAIPDFRKICAMGYENGCKELQKALGKP